MDNKTKRKILKLCEKYKVESDLIDIEAIYDSKINEGENLSVFRDLIESLSESKSFENKIEGDKKTGKKSIKSEKQEIERVELENLQKESEHSEKEFEKTLNQIKLKSTDTLENAFKIPKSLLTTLVKSKKIFGLILKGGAGLGKSYTTLKVFKDLGMKKGKDYNIMSAYTTPLELYQFLYENKDNKIVVLDDTFSFFENKINIGIVLSALWGEGKRIVHYHSSSGKLKVPQSFIFNSKIVWCVNYLPKQLEAVKSRCFYHELDFTYKEKIKLFYEIAKIKNIPLEVVNFIKANSDELTESLDFRLLLKVYDISIHNKDNWEEITARLLGKSEKLILLKTLLKESVSIGEAQKKWCVETGNHRATFYRLKSNLVAKSH